VSLPVEAVPVVPLDWSAGYRIIPSRFPPISLFERVADPDDLETVYEIEALTNDRIRTEVGELALVPPGERVSGPGTGYVMAAFTHVRPEGGRFHDGTFGAFYAAAELATAVAETVYHQERFLRDGQLPPTEVSMRVLRARICADVHDLRGRREALPEIYHPTDYAAGQAFAREARVARSWGIAYDSVRRDGGTCVAVLRPRAVLECKQAQHLGYVWDGERISLRYEKRILRR
jgi:RES domain-containing protein